MEEERRFKAYVDLCQEEWYATLLTIVVIAAIHHFHHHHCSSLILPYSLIRQEEGKPVTPLKYSISKKKLVASKSKLKA